MRGLLLAAIAAVMGCAGAAGDAPELVDAAGADAAPPDAGCGLSFDEAVAAYAPERVCQTTVYDLASGYCTFWQRCSDI